MLRDDDIEITTGRAVGGDFMKVLHKPTGIFRDVGPPLSAPGKTKREALRAIEAELIERGFAQHFVAKRSCDG